MKDLALENIRLGRFLISKQNPNEWDRDDLNQESYLAMRRAQNTFDPARGTFSTHSRSWIRQYAQQWRNLMAHPVRIPRSKFKAELDSVRAASHPSFDEPIFEGGSTLADLLPASSSNPDFRLDVELLLQKLSPADRLVIELRYLRDWPIQRVADELGLKPAGVQAAVRRSMARMRE